MFTRIYNTSVYNTSCEDINECLDEEICDDKINTNCHNTLGSFECQCLLGYNTSVYNTSCQDINECLNKEICADQNNTVCHNTPGSFECECLPGYNTSVYNTSCQDIDECLDKEICADQNNTVCHNTPGSFDCECLPGYNTSVYNTSCHDIDECLDDEICADQNNTVCHNTPGSFDCGCLPGYNTSVYNTSCRDIDECTDTPSLCTEHFVCDNLPGNYRCLCQEGYVLNKDDNSSCVIGTAPRSDGPEGGSSIGMYVGVSIGLLALLSLIVAGIVIRRKRISDKSAKGTTQLSHRDPDSRSGQREIKTLSVEYATVTEMPDMKQDEISVEYSNDKILPKNERINNTHALNKSPQRIIEEIGDLDDREIYSAPYEENVIPSNNSNAENSKFLNLGSCNKTVIPDDSASYNTLTAVSLNPKRCPKAEKLFGKEFTTSNRTDTSANAVERQEPKDSQNSTDQVNAEINGDEDLPGYYNTTDIKVQLLNSRANVPYDTSEINDKKSLKRTADSAVESRILQNQNTSHEMLLPSTEANVEDPDGYNTLEPCNLKRAAHSKVKDRILQDQNTYNIIALPATEAKVQGPDAYNTLESCSVNRAANFETEDRILHGQNGYNTIVLPTKDEILQHSDAYNTLESCSVNRAPRSRIEGSGIDNDKAYNTLYDLNINIKDTVGDDRVNADNNNLDLN